MKIGPVGAEFLQTERRTGGQTDRQIDVSILIVTSHNFANKSEKILYKEEYRTLNDFNPMTRNHYVKHAVLSTSGAPTLHFFMT